MLHHTCKRENTDQLSDKDAPFGLHPQKNTRKRTAGSPEKSYGTMSLEESPKGTLLLLKLLYDRLHRSPPGAEARGHDFPFPGGMGCIDYDQGDSQGSSLELRTPPHPFFIQSPILNYKCNLIQNEISHLLDIGVIESVHSEEKFSVFYSIFLIIQKQIGGTQPF